MAQDWSEQLSPTHEGLRGLQTLWSFATHHDGRECKIKAEDWTAPVSDTGMSLCSGCLFSYACTGYSVAYSMGPSDGGVQHSKLHVVSTGNVSYNNALLNNNRNITTKSPKTDILYWKSILYNSNDAIYNDSPN